MSLMDEYIKKRWNNSQFEEELHRLIIEYNRLRGTYSFLYMADIEKQILESSLMQDDYYIIFDILNNVEGDRIDFFLETPGGSGEVAEEIVRFIRSKFKNVSFIITGQAKSAGTIIALSGDEICMTKTGSLGPIDAQMRIGRSVNSSYDYIEWVEDKRKQAEKTGKLNPFDASIVAQITPGEINRVINAHNYAQDLVKEWLIKYKFKDWNITEKNKTPVTPEMKERRAAEIAEDLTNQEKWRTHGRSIKINDLHDLGLKIKNIDEDPIVADVVYRIHTVCRFLFMLTNSLKIFSTADNKIFRQIQSNLNALPLQQLIPIGNNVNAVELNVECSKCGQKFPLYAKLKNDGKIDNEMQKKGRKNFPSNCIIECKCGNKIDLKPFKDDIESRTHKKISI